MVFCLLFVAYHSIFYQFYPNGSGRLGHDYALAVPGFLAGYYWFQSNGIWEVPWFTPGFCGGQPFFADAQSGYYSVFQFLTLIVDPLSSLYLSMLLFAALGYWGCYFLLRRCFAVSWQSAVVAAAIFMFNGFFAHRMIIGHLGYQGFMLIPWMTYLLVVPTPAVGFRWPNTTAAGCLAGVVGAYWVHSRLGTLLIPAGLAVALMLLMYWIWVSQPRTGQIVYRSLFGALVAAALSASKLVAGISFLANFPRSDYLLPGYQSIGAATKIAIMGLFISPPDIEKYSNALLKNVQWSGGRPDLEYGVTMVPLLILAVVACIGIARLATGKAVFEPLTRDSARPDRHDPAHAHCAQHVFAGLECPAQADSASQVEQHTDSMVHHLHSIFCLGFGDCLRANHGFDAYLRGDSRGRAGGRNQLDAGSKVIHSGAL